MLRPLFLLALTALPAAAQTSGYQAVTCSASARQGAFTTCEGFAPVTLAVAAPGAIQGIRVAAPATHCSPVAYSVLRAPYASGADVIASSGILRAGQSETLTLGRDFGAGGHPLRLIANGVVEGCNAGQMHSWGVNWTFVIIPE
jgi:hypothetical protein